MKYNLVLPTSVESTSGWVENSRPVFVIKHEGEEIKPGSVRLNGLLQISKLVNGVPTVLDPTDLMTIDPDAGVHGFIHQIVTKFGHSTVENITEYGKFVKMKNEAKRYQIDNATSTHAMCELRTYSNDANVSTTDVKINALSGMMFPPDSGTTGAYELPFSMELEIAVNNADANIPYSRTEDIEISITLQSNTKTGMTSYKAVPVAGEVYQYALKYLELRYSSEMEKSREGAIVLQTKSLAYTPTVQNKSASLEYAATSAFDSVVMSFLDVTHLQTLNNKNFNYLQTETITEKLDNLEVKINGQNNVLQYPLRFQTAEILYNYLLAFKPYIQNYDSLETMKHGLTYKKLANATQTAGYGLGCAFLDGLDAGTRVQFNLELQDVPTNPYQAFVYSIGKLII